MAFVILTVAIAAMRLLLILELTDIMNGGIVTTFGPAYIYCNRTRIFPEWLHGSPVADPAWLAGVLTVSGTSLFHF